MKIIGLDSSTERLAIGVCEGERIAEYSVDAGRRHSSLLAPHLERVMREMKWRYDQLDYCACGIGPGSFTGLRIGVAAVKGIAFAAGIPVVGISTLDIIAANALSFGTFPRVAVLLDARRQLFYWSIYSLGRRGALSRTQPYKLTSFDEAARAMRGEIAVTGDGIAACNDVPRKRLSRATILDKDYWYPGGGPLIALARQRIAEGRVSDAFRIKPLYLYPKECQIKGFADNTVSGRTSTHEKNSAHTSTQAHKHTR